jgi:hypothetical protein
LRRFDVPNTPTPIISEAVDSSIETLSSRILDGFTLLGPTGCLTDEALCFLDELETDQRAVVQRHLASCVACSHLHNEMRRATRLIRRNRPRTSVSSDVRLAGKQAILRELLKQRARAKQQTRATRRGRLWVPLLLGISGALAVLAILLAIFG